MADDKSELFGGSVDRSRLEEMKAAAGDDPDRLARVAEVQAQADAVAESDAAAETASQQQAAAGVYTADEVREQEARKLEPTASSETAPSEDLSSLNKDQLVDRAKASGINTAGKNKDELVNELKRRAR